MNLRSSASQKISGSKGDETSSSVGSKSALDGGNLFIGTRSSASSANSRPWRWSRWLGSGNLPTETTEPWSRFSRIRRDCDSREPVGPRLESVPASCVLRGC